MKNVLRKAHNNGKMNSFYGVLRACACSYCACLACSCSSDKIAGYYYDQNYGAQGTVRKSNEAY